MSDWAANNPERKRFLRRRSYRRHAPAIRARNLIKKYGITAEEFDARRKSQGFCCAICGVPESKCYRGLHLDHDHTTGKNRGLLCSPCNIGLGMFKDSGTLLDSAKRYLTVYTRPVTPQVSKSDLSDDLSPA